MSETLVHNPKNAVTERIERRVIDGQAVVVKVFSCKNREDTPVEWRASTEPRHWNYWAREASVYECGLNEHLLGTGVRLPTMVSLVQSEAFIELTMEDVIGRTGSDLTLQDCGLIAKAWGRAQGQLLKNGWQMPEWTSQKFLRNYAQSKPADYELLATQTQKGRSAWTQPLIKENWPPELADGLAALYANRELLWEMLESAPQSPCHLDFWPNNVIVSERDEVVLIDWAFFGSGSLAEDVGNFIPDAIFDGFFAGEDFSILEATMWRAYTAGLADFDVGLDLPLRRYLHASAVKYVWLAPLLLARAKDAHQLSYGGEAIVDQLEVNEQYRARGLALMRLCEWADQAVKEKHEIG